MDRYHVQISDEGKSLIKAGRLRVVESAGKPIDPYVLDENKFVELVKHDAAQFLRNEARDMPLVEVDTATFKVFDYPEGGTLVDMKKHLGIAGFPLTKAEGLNAMFARETENGK